MPRLVPRVVPVARIQHSEQPMVRAPSGLMLRPWLLSDASVVVAAYSDPAIQQWHRRHVLSEDEARELIAGWNQRWQAETGGYWVIVRRETGEAVGRMSLGNLDLDEGLAECSYWVLPAARGSGVATSALLGPLPLGA